MAVRLVRGDTWTRAWELRDAAGAPIDLTGATARLQVRDDADAVLIAASTSDGRITVTATAGRIDMKVPYSATALAPGSYRFDLEVTHADGTRRTYEQDTLVVLADVARD
jgi:DNA-binding IclR family transcriptional regulator